MKNEDGSIVLWRYFAARGTGVCHKIDDVTRKATYVETLIKCLKTSTRKLKLGSNWVFCMNSNLRHEM